MEKKQQSKMEVKLSKREQSYKIVIPAKVERQIRLLCSKVWDTEWSGILFYTPSGSFEDGTLQIRCEDILPMDIGSQAYTEFDFSPDVVSYMTENPELLRTQQGLIHSHNNMATFFSGTDIATLREEGIDRNHFVSLIVNNAGKYTAAITRKISSKNVSYKSFNNVEVKCKDSNDTVDLEYFDLDIVFEEFPGIDAKSIEDRLDAIKKSKEAKASKAVPLSSGVKAPKWGMYGKTDEEDTLFHFNDSFDYLEDDTFIPKFDKTVTKDGYTKITPKKSPIDKDDIEPINFDVSKKYIEDCVKQLVTGDITMTGKTTALKDLAKRMEPIFDKRFSKKKGDMEFSDWANSFIEVLVWNARNSKDEIIEDPEAAGVVAQSIIDTFYEAKMVDMKYIKEYIDILSTYYQ